MADPMGDQRTCGTTVPGASAHDGSARTRLGIIWVFPFPTSLTTYFEAARIVLGRSEDCDVVLEGAEISRHHAEVLRIGSEWVIRDLNSRNGVEVDAERVESSTLHVGNVVRVGEWIGVVRAIELDAERTQLPFRELSPGFVGGAHLQRAVADAERIARTRTSIVIQGELGTGKKQLARAIHHWSGRTGKVIVINCATLPDRLAEGDIQAADAGTLLLDEVSEVPLSLQPKLLRALDAGLVTTTTGSTESRVDVRVIVSTQEPLERAVEQRRLRADLCSRLAGLTIPMPTLRERSEDIPGLFAHLLQRHWRRPLPTVDARLVQRLCRHHWPYNVHELEQLCSYLGDAHAQETRLRLAHLPKSMQPIARSAPPSIKEGTFDDVTLRENIVRQDLEKRQQRERDRRSLNETLRLCHGNVSKAAAALGISRQKIYRMLQGAASAELEDLRQAPAPSDATPADAKS
ncbi:MAG TPA: sigma 54-interacting transcriptional regulator [Polyangiaceae bacterium]